MGVVISKSGSTIEPMSNYMVVRQAMEDAGINLKPSPLRILMKAKETLLHGLARNRAGLFSTFQTESADGSASSPK